MTTRHVLKDKTTQISKLINSVSSSRQTSHVLRSPDVCSKIEAYDQSVNRLLHWMQQPTGVPSSLVDTLNRQADHIIDILTPLQDQQVSQ